MSKCLGRWIDRRKYDRELSQRVDPDQLTIGSFWAVRLSLAGSSDDMPAAEFPIQTVSRKIGSEVGSRILSLSFVDPNFRPALTVVARTMGGLILPPIRLVVISEPGSHTYAVNGGYFTEYRDLDGFEEQLETAFRDTPVESAAPLPGELIRV